MNEPTHSILIAEDEESLQMVLADRLQAEGYEVEIAEDGPTAYERAGSGSFDLLVLDVALPGRTGLDVCRDLRAEASVLPILMLTARSQTLDKVLGLKLGADDYLTKPFEMDELLARIEALLRRSGAATSPSDRLRVGDVEIDIAGAEVLKQGRTVDLSALEFKLLEFLARHPGTVHSRDELLDKVWGYQADVYTRTVDVHVASLRQKLEDQPRRPRLIVTVHGRGYKLVR